MRKLTKQLQVKLQLSTAYHPQTDGQSERFHSTMLTTLRAFVNHHHSDWSEHIPAMLYAYHNTIHTATGYTPHMLLFDWSPRDLRAPVLSADLQMELCLLVTKILMCGVELQVRGDDREKSHNRNPAVNGARGAPHRRGTPRNARNGRSGQSRPGRCHNCGEPGHWAHECSKANPQRSDVQPRRGIPPAAFTAVRKSSCSNMLLSRYCVENAPDANPLSTILCLVVR